MKRTYLYSGTAEHPVYTDVVAAASDARKLPIVMLHGGFHNGTAFLATPDGREGWATFYARRGHDVYVVDWPGHGRSPSTPAFLQLSMMDVGRSLGALLQEIGPAIVFAHSAGGPIAWWVAENYRAFVVAVVGIAPGAPANLIPALPACAGTSSDDDTGGHPVYAPIDRPAFVDRAFIRQFWANSPRFPQEAFEAYARSIGPESPRILNERFNIGGSALRLTHVERLKSIPVLVITGDRDPRHPKELDGALAEFLGADFCWLPDVGIKGNGHMMMIEDNHEQLAECISVWLAERGL
ncbi:alpha/beta hydrolase [Pandoraea oxalativorans]|uniref:Alpha/beta hydrolase n=1 Tax=Pandoraea oxalativorans TaxID=573737 RepID=A0A0E3U9U4_9BURK|nr:alpha/beta hydrolase [Pandoraea oxalativorans]